MQGVGFRYFCQRQATLRNLTGWVRNRVDGTVEAEVQGEEATVQDFIKQVRRGPGNARVDSVEENWKDAAETYNKFEIRH